MQAPPSMSYAAAVAEALLGGLADGLPPSAALAAGRSTASDARPEYGLPVLFSAETASSMDPDPTTDVHGLRSADSMDG